MTGFISNDRVDATYQKLEKLGEGTYGVVYKVRNRKTGEIFAMKKIRMDGDEEGLPATSLREIASLRELSAHPNIVKLLSLMIEDQKVFLVFEYLQYDLKKFLDQHERNKTKPDATVIRSFTYQLLLGLDYAHRRSLPHRDLKPQNILIDSTGTIVRIADFGLARVFALPVRAYTHEIVTLWYRCPEVLLGSQRYSLEVDVWSVGCILCELVSLRPLFPGDSEIDQLYRIFRLLGTPTNETWPGVEQLRDYNASFPRWRENRLRECIHCQDESLMHLLSALLTLNPAKRITADQALKHQYFSPLLTRQHSLSKTVAEQFPDNICERLHRAAVSTALESISTSDSSNSASDS